MLQRVLDFWFSITSSVIPFLPVYPPVNVSTVASVQTATTLPSGMFILLQQNACDLWWLRCETRQLILDNCGYISCEHAQLHSRWCTKIWWWLPEKQTNMGPVIHFYILFSLLFHKLSIWFSNHRTADSNIDRGYVCYTSYFVKRNFISEDITRLKSKNSKEAKKSVKTNPQYLHQIFNFPTVNHWFLLLHWHAALGTKALGLNPSRGFSKEFACGSLKKKK